MRQEEQEPESLEVIYELALSRLESQVRQIEGVDTKLNFVISVASLVIGVGTTLFVGRAQDIVSWTKISFTVSGVIYLLVVVVAIRAYAFLDLEYPPNVRQVWLDALYWPRQITKRQVLSQIVQALELNRANL
jgi:exonuclease VII small subunit